MPRMRRTAARSTVPAQLALGGPDDDGRAGSSDGVSAGKLRQTFELAGPTATRYSVWPPWV